jgi:hypothetical protein
MSSRRRRSSARRWRSRSRLARRGRQAPERYGKRSELEEPLADLLDQVTPENRHGELDWGVPAGKEVW